MTCISKSATIVVAVASLLAGTSDADTLTRTIEYHPDAQPTIMCAAGSLCEIRLAFGERIRRIWSAQAPLWAPDASDVNGRPVIALKPEFAGFHTSVSIITDHREYRLQLVSYDGTKQSYPSDVNFAYNDEARHQARVLAMQPKPVPTQTPLTVAQQMDAACGKMPADEQYGIDPQPAFLHPQGTPARNGRSVCHTLDATYIQMPLGGPEPTDIPTVVEDAPDGVRIVNVAYDPTSRIFHVDDVATEYALVSGKTRVRIQRQIGNSAAACAIPQKSKR